MIVYSFLFFVVILLVPFQTYSAELPTLDANGLRSIYEQPFLDAGDTCRPTWTCHTKPIPTDTLSCSGNSGVGAAADEYIIRPGNISTSWNQINNTAYQYFFVCPGDYSALAQIVITQDGTSANRQWLTWYDSGSCADVHAFNMISSCEATVEGLQFRDADFWNVDRLEITDPSFNEFRTLDLHLGSSNNIFNMIHLHDGETLYFTRTASSNNLMQNSVIHTTRISSSEFACTFILSSQLSGPTEDNKLVNNEIFNCQGDEFHMDDFVNPEHNQIAPGTIVDNNDMYKTTAMYTNCNGVFTTSGVCSCAEQAVDMKIGGSPIKINRITNNRMWGFRATGSGTTNVPGVGDPSICQGSNDQFNHAILLNRSGPQAEPQGTDYVLIKGNIIFDSENGIWSRNPVNNVSILENYIWDVANKAAPRGAVSFDGGDAIEFYRNVVVDSDRYIYWNSNSDNIDVRCNAFIDSGSATNFESISATSDVQYNGWIDIDIVESENIGDIVRSVSTRSNSTAYSIGELLYADSPSTCTTGTQDGCFIYAVTSAGISNSSKPTLPTACGGTVTDGSVTLKAVFCPKVFSIKRWTEPTTKAIPYVDTSDADNPLYLQQCVNNDLIFSDSFE